jgi:DNA repair protein RadC
MMQTVLNLRTEELPREKLLASNAQSLTDTELLALILRSGSKDVSVMSLANRVLLEFGGWKGLLETDFQQLTDFKNVGTAKAASIKAACEVAARINFSAISGGEAINTPDQVYRSVIKDFYNKKQEQLGVISLDSKNRIISSDIISVGTVNETLIHPREVFRRAVLRNAVAIILVHNHPSGDPTPSTDDIRVTERLVDAGNNIGVPVLDHLILSDGGYASLKVLNLIKSNNLKS